MVIGHLDGHLIYYSSKTKTCQTKEYVIEGLPKNKWCNSYGVTLKKNQGTGELYATTHRYLLFMNSEKTEVELVLVYNGRQFNMTRKLKLYKRRLGEC